MLRLSFGHNRLQVRPQDQGHGHLLLRPACKRCGAQRCLEKGAVAGCPPADWSLCGARRDPLGARWVACFALWALRAAACVSANAKGHKFLTRRHQLLLPSLYHLCARLPKAAGASRACKHATLHCCSSRVWPSVQSIRSARCQAAECKWGRTTVVMCNTDCWQAGCCNSIGMMPSGGQVGDIPQVY